jgi:hypothetical protein
MDKIAVKKAILSALSEEIDLWLDKSEGIKDGYEYETEFINTARHVNKILLSNSLGDVLSNRNSKKNFTPVSDNLK